MNIYNTITQLKNNKFSNDFIWSILSTIILAGSAISVNILVGNVYGFETLGILTQALAYYSIISLFAVLGLQTSVSKHVAEHNANSKTTGEILISAYILTFTISCAISLTLIFALENLGALISRSELTTALKYLVIGLPLFSINKISMGYLNGIREIKLYSIIQSLRWIIILFFIAAILIINKSFIYILFIFPLTELILFLIIFAGFCNKINFAKPNGFHWFRIHLSFGGKLTLASSAGELNSKIDILMLGLLLSDKIAGIYSVAISIIRGLLLISGIIQRNFNPIITKLYSENNIAQIQHYIKKIRRYSNLIYIPTIIISVFAYPIFIQIGFNDPELTKSIWSFNILLVGVFFSSLYGPFGAIFTQTGFPNIQLKIISLTTLCNIILNAILINILGIAGAAISTTLSFLMTYALITYYSKKVLHVSII